MPAEALTITDTARVYVPPVVALVTVMTIMRTPTAVSAGTVPENVPAPALNEVHELVSDGL